MSMHAETRSTSVGRTERHPSGVHFPSWLGKAAAALAVWGLLVLGLQQIWFHFFGFSGEEALVLSLAILIILGMLTGLMLFMSSVLRSGF